MFFSKISLAVVLFLSLLVLVSACETEQDRRVWGQTQEALDFFKGEHQIRNIRERTSVDGTRIEFEWKQQNAEVYVASSVPYEKIRVQVVNDTQTPHVSFVLKCHPDMFHGFPGSCHNVYDFMKGDLQRVFERYVTSVTFVVREEDWPLQTAK